MGNIMLPVVLLGIMGFVFGAVLTFAAKKLAVPVDPIVAEVRAELPGANCGACGYAGCDDYAAAFGEDRCTSPSKCPVGGPDLAAKLAEILGVEADDSAQPLAVVMCQGTKSLAEDYLQYEANITCTAATQLFGGNKSCVYGCLGGGDCARACEFDAITIVDGLAVIDPEKCVGCGACAKACPKNVIEMLTADNRVKVRCHSVDKGAKVTKACKIGCIGCMRCVKECRFDASHVENFLAKIDYEKCVNCGACARVCPTKAIEVIPRKKKAKPVAKTAEDEPAKEAAAN